MYDAFSFLQDCPFHPGRGSGWYCYLHSCELLCHTALLALERVQYDIPLRRLDSLAIQTKSNKTARHLRQKVKSKSVIDLNDDINALHLRLLVERHCHQFTLQMCTSQQDDSWQMNNASWISIRIWIRYKSISKWIMTFKMIITGLQFWAWIDALHLDSDDRC